MFCFSRANHARSSLKKFWVDNSTSSFYLPTSLSAETWKSLQTCCVNYFVRLRWHFKRENLIRILESIFNAKQNVKLTVSESTTTTTNFRSKARVWIENLGCKFVLLTNMTNILQSLQQSPVFCVLLTTARSPQAWPAVTRTLSRRERENLGNKVAYASTKNSELTHEAPHCHVIFRHLAYIV